MDWLVYSPDLNTIEVVWDMLGRQTAARQPPPTCLPELWRAFLDEWCNIPQDQIDNLIFSMPRRWSSRIIRFQIHVPCSKTHTGLNFNAPARENSAAGGNENSQVGLEREAIPPDSGNILQVYGSFQNLISDSCFHPVEEEFGSPEPAISVAGKRHYEASGN
ncbi:transposable element Tcb2 transposase [Trichonephila clavipes]|nr:transposable element Tcb2 transposase [Trichonephila clavipes]